MVIYTDFLSEHSGKSALWRIMLSKEVGSLLGLIYTVRSDHHYLPVHRGVCEDSELCENSSAQKAS